MSGEKTIAIVQSSYIPWRGYFDLIRAADHFVLLDDVQFTRRDWRNRNRIKTANGRVWLTIPVASKGARTQRIRDVEVTDAAWAERHWRSLRHAYGRAAHFDANRDAIARCYDQAGALRSLSEINALFLRTLSGMIGIETPVSFSDEVLPLAELDPLDSSARLASLTAALGGTRYLSGPRATNYLVTAPFEARSIEVAFVNYDNYEPYPQLHGAFEPFVSIVDLLFCAGPDVLRHMGDLGASATPARCVAGAA